MMVVKSRKSLKILPNVMYVANTRWINKIPIEIISCFADVQLTLSEPLLPDQVTR